jgi:DNA-binding response OmpR family regulator
LPVASLKWQISRITNILSGLVFRGSSTVWIINILNGLVFEERPNGACRILINMKKTILLYSENKENIEKIKRILESKNYHLQTEKTIEGLGFRTKDAAALLIIDMTNLKELNLSRLKELNTGSGKPDISKIFIISTPQISFLIKNEIRFDDFVLYAQLEEELSARIKSVALKNKIFPPKNSIVVNDLVLNFDKYELSVNQKPVELTFKEFELFKLLLQNQDKVFSRNKLLSAVWDYDFYGGSRTVDVHIRRLRSKIPPPYNLMLKTVRNVGYMFSTHI